MKYTCAFCGKKHEGYGNSCWPIYNDERIRCCDGCNKYIVVPERIRQAQESIVEDNKLENEECY